MWITSCIYVYNIVMSVLFESALGLDYVEYFLKFIILRGTDQELAAPVELLHFI